MLRAPALLPLASAGLPDPASLPSFPRMPLVPSSFWGALGSAQVLESLPRADSDCTSSSLCGLETDYLTLNTCFLVCKMGTLIPTTCWSHWKG